MWHRICAFESPGAKNYWTHQGSALYGVFSLCSEREGHTPSPCWGHSFLSWAAPALLSTSCPFSEDPTACSLSQQVLELILSDKRRLQWVCKLHSGLPWSIRSVGNAILSEVVNAGHLSNPLNCTCEVCVYRLYANKKLIMNAFCTIKESLKIKYCLPEPTNLWRAQFCRKWRGVAVGGCFEPSEGQSSPPSFSLLPCFAIFTYELL